jgi:hypothetical protein
LPDPYEMKNSCREPQYIMCTWFLGSHPWPDEQIDFSCQ